MIIYFLRIFHLIVYIQKFVFVRHVGANPANPMWKYIFFGLLGLLTILAYFFFNICYMYVFIFVVVVNDNMLLYGVQAGPGCLALASFFFTWLEGTYFRLGILLVDSAEREFLLGIYFSFNTCVFCMYFLYWFFSNLL